MLKVILQMRKENLEKWDDNVTNKNMFQNYQNSIFWWKINCSGHYNKILIV